MVGVGRVRLDQAALLLTGLRRLVVLQQDGLRIKRRWVLTEKQCLHLDELDVRFVFASLTVGLRCDLASRLLLIGRD